MGDSSEDIIRKVIKESEDKFGKGAVTSFGTESPSDVTSWIHTGSYALDSVIGRGIPRGRIVEIFGPESTGKTTLGLQVLAITQQMGGIAAMIDTETSYDAARAKSIGLDTSKLLYAQIDTMEDCFQFLKLVSHVVKDAGPDKHLTLLWDSLAATPAKDELESEFGKRSYGRGANVISSSLRMMKRELTWNNVTLLVVNQIRDAIGDQWGPKVNTYGGWAMKFYASVRLDLKKVEVLKTKNARDEERAYGVKVRVKVVKNKVAAPFGECEIVIDFMRGIDGVASDVVYAADHGMIPGGGGWYTLVIPGVQKEKWRYTELEAHFREHPDQIALLYNLEGKKTAQVDSIPQDKPGDEVVRTARTEE